MIDAGESVAKVWERELWEGTRLSGHVTRLMGVYSDPHHVADYPDSNLAHIIIQLLWASWIGLWEFR
jgi:ADP-ribose pyrophosphatase YjhB (NUDIX family)